MKALSNRPTRSGLDLLSLISVQPENHHFSESTIGLLRSIYPFVEQFDLTAEPDTRFGADN